MIFKKLRIFLNEKFGIFQLLKVIFGDIKTKKFLLGIFFTTFSKSKTLLFIY